MDNLRIIYSEILKGYSQLNTPQFRGIFIKHLNSFDIAEVDLKYQEYYNKAISTKIPTEKEKLEYLNKEKLWTKENDEEINDLNSAVDSLQKTKIKCIVKAEVKLYNEKIQESQNKINELNRKKQELLGITAEYYTNKRINDYYLLISLYGKNIQNRLFTEEEFDDLDEFQIKEITTEYNKLSDNFKYLKKIALAGFFLNAFALAENDPVKFYGKCIINLTFYQIELFSQGKQFHRILSECHNKVPEEILTDPDKLLEWYYRVDNAKKMLDKAPETAGAMSIVGATKEDLAEIGVDTSDCMDLSKELQKHGGSMNMQQILALHG